MFVLLVARYHLILGRSVLFARMTYSADKMATPLGTWFFDLLLLWLEKLFLCFCFFLMCVGLGRFVRFWIISCFSRFWKRTAPSVCNTVRTSPHFCFTHRVVPHLGILGACGPCQNFEKLEIFSFSQLRICLCVFSLFLELHVSCQKLFIG